MGMDLGRVVRSLMPGGSIRLVARGTPAEIMTPRQLEAIYGVPMSVMVHPSTKQPLGFAN